jgi:aspartyl-tRNA(Asn)/glutamyl-tRNA(Gln) amidotransferase subunit C
VASEQINIAHVAQLARLALTPDETIRFGKQLGSLLEHVRVLQSLPLDDVPATAQVIPSRNEMREDDVRPSLRREVVLAGAPVSEGVYIRVPRILGEDA